MPIRPVHDAGLVMAHGTDQVQDRWGLITADGAAILDHEDADGIEARTPADLAVHRTRSPQWAIIERVDPRYVLKNGRIVATDGAVTDVPTAN